MQFNIHGWRDTYHKDNFERVVASVLEEQPDVLVLNEVLHPYVLPSVEGYLQLVKAGQGNGFVDPDLPTPDESYLHKLSLATGLHYYTFGQATADGYFGSFGFGNAILSRFKLEEVQHTVLKAESFEYAADRRIEAEDRAVSSALVCGSTPLRVFTSHLDQLDEGLREQQAQVIVDQMQALPGSILVGDMNTYQAQDYSPEGWQTIQAMWASRGWGKPPALSASLQAFASGGLADSHYLCHRNIGTWAEPTCWTIDPKFRIDYAFMDQTAQAEWEVEQIGRLDSATCSDHFPIALSLVPVL